MRTMLRKARSAAFGLFLVIAYAFAALSTQHVVAHGMRFGRQQAAPRAQPSHRAFNESFLQQLRNAGFNGVTARDAISMRALSVTITDVRNLRSLFPMISLNQAPDLAMFGVNATYCGKCVPPAFAACAPTTLSISN